MTSNGVDKVNGITDQYTPTRKRRSLLNKYQIPINHLSFEYIEACKDIKELERIVKILRSNEEGFFPELQKAAEDQLKILNPESCIFKKEEPCLKRSTMDNEDWFNDLTDWARMMKLEDYILAEEMKKNIDMNLTPEKWNFPLRTYPAFRGNQEKMIKKSDAVFNYAKWKKYDADFEIQKIEYQKERENERNLQSMKVQMVKEKKTPDKAKQSDEGEKQIDESYF